MPHLGPVELVLLVLAAYRLTRLVVEDAIFDRPRDRLLAWLSAHRLGKVTEALSCFWCTGVWASLLLYAAWAAAADTWTGTSLVAHAVAVLAVAGGQGLLGSWEGQ